MTKCNLSIYNVYKSENTRHKKTWRVGNTILEQGGNAYDAAVAVAACLNVVYPHMTGAGGDSFWLTYTPKEGKVRAYNGAGRSGSKVTRDLYKGKDAIPFRGIEAAIVVPGQVDAWDTLVSEYGNLTLKEVLAPAIDYATYGFPYTRDQHINTNMESLLSFTEHKVEKDNLKPKRRLLLA